MMDSRTDSRGSHRQSGSNSSRRTDGFLPSAEKHEADYSR